MTQSSALSDNPRLGDKTGSSPAKIQAWKPYLFRILLIYRWGSLLPALAILTPLSDTPTFLIEPLYILLFMTSLNIIITLFQPSFNTTADNALYLLLADIVLMLMVLISSGVTDSPYFLHALSPLLMAAFLLESLHWILLTTTYTAVYLVATSQYQNTGRAINIPQLLSQISQILFFTFVVGLTTRLLTTFERNQQRLFNHNQQLSQRNNMLETQHHRLEVAHELTLFLHLSDSQSVQQRLLRAVTKDLNFSQVVVGLVNPILNRIDDWQAEPMLISQATPLSLTEEGGCIAKAVLNQQARWYLPLTPQSEAGVALNTDDMTMFNLRVSPTNDLLTDWLGSGGWLVLPMTWQQQPVGVLLVAVETNSTIDISDDRWAILTSLVSQAAVALGTIDRTRRLAVEQERNRIARDIHDTVAQSLFGMAFTLDACTKLLPDHVETVQQELAELRDIAQSTHTQVRQSILNMWPSKLTITEFQVDLDKYVTHCAPDHVFQVDYVIEGDFDGLSAGIRRNLYRVSQEALANAARYAGVNMARLYLCVEPNEISLSIRDNGMGFDVKQSMARERDREHFGLRGMQERIEVLGGSCDILSQMGYGTQILARIPLKQRKKHV
ncbi:sensor histidine kinase [Anaerolineales bacterium HSG6]|nr:sensor histidine kinase [Anaerolineales bacterium HSG6]MDM8532546.1 sensor histidine kinase [Anaerolineales bacterium HSG25]